MVLPAGSQPGPSHVPSRDRHTCEGGAAAAAQQQWETAASQQQPLPSPPEGGRLALPFA